MQRVRKIMPSHYVLHRNSDGKTADELFNEKHKDLLKKAQEWIKETSQPCSAVAVLVAIVVFTAAYTIPGGNDDKGGPIFLHSHFFLFFTVMDVVSLASSLTFVVMFLSILTSPFEPQNFLKFLLRKLMVGFTLLFFSVTCNHHAFIHGDYSAHRSAWGKNMDNNSDLHCRILSVSVFALMQFPFILHSPVFGITFQRK